MSDSKKRLNVVMVIFSALIILATTSTANAKPTHPLIPLWNAINNLQQQVNDLYNITVDLQNQIENIQSIPGPQGSTGANGLACWDLNGNGMGDPAEDVNLDDNYDAFDCRGTKGDQGEQGLPGMNGISGWERISVTSVFNSDYDKSASASCTGTKKIIGGGGLSSKADMIILGSYPISDNTWTVNAKSGGTLEWSVTAYAICANV